MSISDVKSLVLTHLTKYKKDALFKKCPFTWKLTEAWIWFHDYQMFSAQRGKLKFDPIFIWDGPISKYYKTDFENFYISEWALILIPHYWVYWYIWIAKFCQFYRFFESQFTIIHFHKNTTDNRKELTYLLASCNS